MKKITATLAAVLAGAGFSAAAQADDAASAFSVTGSAAVVSQYRFRGVSQSDNLPVVQGAITVSHSSGFYVSTWGSSASSKNSPVNIGGTEIDAYGGYTHTFAPSGVTIDGGVYGYLYPGATAGNYVEVYGSVAKAIGPASAKVGVYYAPAQKVFNYNFTSPTRHNAYIYGELGSAIPGTAFSVHSHLGHTAGGFDYGKAYFDYSAGVSYKWKALTFDASVVGTDLSKSDVARGFGVTGTCSDGEGGVSATCVSSLTTFYHRPVKTVGVVSVTASF